MPELTVFRNSPVPYPPVCMYCGHPSTSAKEWREENRRPNKNGGGGGTSVVSAPVGDDSVSAVIAIVLLPLALWELLKGLVIGIGAVAGWLKRPNPPSPSSPPVSPEPPPTTLVVVTTCDRHRHFRRRFGWAWVGMGVVLAGLWVWALIESTRVWGTENVDFATALCVTAVFATVLLPFGVGILRFFFGPVIVDRVSEETVVLDRVRQAYFDAAGLKPTEPGK